MAKDAIPLGHNSIKAIKIAANALHMARTEFEIYLWELSREVRSRFSDEGWSDYSDFRLFRERLEYWGVVDRLIAPPFEYTGLFAAFDPRLKALFSSDADFIHITLREMPFSDDEWAELNAVKPLDVFDMEQRICEMHPSPLLTELRAIVLRHLECHYAAPVDFPSHKGKAGEAKTNGGPRPAVEVRKAKVFSERLIEYERVTSSQPKLNLRKNDFIEVMISKFGFSESSAIASIWATLPKVSRWRKAGRRDQSYTHISRADIEEYFCDLRDAQE